MKYLLLLSFLVGSALASSKTFYYPDRNGEGWPSHCARRLDWCLVNGRFCGRYAAHDYCRMEGYKYASSYYISHGVGATRTIGDNKYCSGHCDGFFRITCRNKTVRLFDNANGPVKLYYPKVGAKSLDWCLVFEHHCGQRAADSYCRMQGFKKAKDFRKRHITNASEKTACIGDYRICDPTNHGCDSFHWIECSNYYCI